MKLSTSTTPFDTSICRKVRYDIYSSRGEKIVFTTIYRTFDVFIFLDFRYSNISKVRLFDISETFRYFDISKLSIFSTYRNFRYFDISKRSIFYFRYVETDISKISIFRYIETFDTNALRHCCCRPSPLVCILTLHLAFFCLVCICVPIGVLFHEESIASADDVRSSA